MLIASDPLFVAAVVSAVLAAICVVAIDRPLALWIVEFEPSTLWDRGIEVLEWTVGLPVLRLFSSVALVAGMLVVMAVPRWRVHAPVWMLMAGTHVVCRFLSFHIKGATGRLRPNEWMAHGGDGTFWRDGIGFPSGHVVLFASIVIPLAVVAPRTRPLLAIVGFVMAARMAVNEHWASDVIASITLVALVAWMLAWALRVGERRRRT
ncbi:MAG: phosphatase PAP2 family protein [Deltaproteobacteria bacterium]|nr:phosphatase PAP2 family protein [Deltaproteobacteria bacterium]MDQ3299316.1 phosphatase PAP2 family protein [Myxococcota bacterium]